MRRYLLFLASLSTVLIVTAGCTQAGGKTASLSITPATAALDAGAAAVTFSAKVENSTAAVRWELSGVGSIEPDTGSSTAYTPPASVSSETRVTLTATLENSSVKAVATITVHPSAEAILYVDAVHGSDANPGSSSAPLKSLRRALSHARAGMTVRILAGTYDVSNGEAYPETVPDGVTVLADNARDILLVGKPTQDGLILAGSATLAGLDLRNFNTALTATTGDQALNNLALSDNIVSLSVSGNSQLTLDGNSSLAGGQQGIVLADTAKFTMEGGTVRGMLSNGSGGGIVTTGSASFKLTDVAFVDNPARWTVLMSDMSSGEIRTSSFKRNTVARGSGAVIEIRDSTRVALADTDIMENGDDGIFVTGEASVTVSGGCLCSNGEFGIEMTSGRATVSGTRIGGDALAGIDVRGGTIDLTGAVVSDSGYGISFGPQSHPAGIKLRGTRVTNNDHAGINIGIQGTDTVDLGTAADPGGNVLQDNGTNVELDEGASPIDAVGNTWDRSAQGSDAEGRYSSQLVNGPVEGKNYRLRAGTSLQL